MESVRGWDWPFHAFPVETDGRRVKCKSLVLSILQNQYFGLHWTDRSIRTLQVPRPQLRKVPEVGVTIALLGIALNLRGRDGDEARTHRVNL